MDYHSAQPGAPIVSNQPSLPASSPLPPSSSAGVGGTWDRLEADIKALQQQALATQKAIQQVQSRDATGPLDAAQATLAGADGINVPLVGAGTVLALILALLARHVWMHPKDSLNAPPAPVSTTHGEATPTEQPAATPHPTSAPLDAKSAHVDTASPESLFARVDPNMGFDPEVAANEVVRVRRSLAEKREARAMQLERDDAGMTPDAHAWLNMGTPDSMDGVQVTSGPIPMTQHEPALDAEADIALDLDQPPAAPEPNTGPDFSITLALAQESMALDLWPEARELATEVLDSGDANLRAQAQALLIQLNQLEQNLSADSES